MRGSSEPYEVKCRRGCGKTVTLGVNNKGAWMPYDDYELRELHNCPLYKRGGSSGGGSGSTSDSQQGKTIQQSRQEEEEKKQQQALYESVAELKRQNAKIIDYCTGITWQLEGVRKKMGLDLNDDSGEEGGAAGGQNVL